MDLHGEQVEVDLLGETRTLHYTMLAWRAYEAKTGHSILRAPVTEEHLKDVPRAMALLWAGLRLHHPDLTLEELDRGLTLRDMDRILPAIREAIQRTSPELSPGEGEREEGSEDPPTAQS